MPVFEFTGPDGRVVELEGPEGTTQEQALKVFQGVVRNIPTEIPAPAPQAAPEPEEAPWYKRLTAATVEPMLRTGLGVRKSVMSLYPESWQEMAAPMTEGMERDLATFQETAGEGALPLAGRIVGEAMTFAGPGGLGAQLGRRALPKTLAAGRYAPGLAVAGGEASAIGALEAARTQGSAQERAEAAALAAGGALAGHGLGAGIQKMVQGVRPSAQGQELLQYGATPGRVAEGRFVPWAEEQLRRVPGWGGIDRLQQRAIENWDEAILKSVWPGAEGIGFEAIDGIQKQIGKAYDDTWARGAELTKFIPKGEGKEQIVFDSLNRMASQFDDATAKNLGNFLNRQVTSLIKSQSGKAWQRFNTQTRDYASSLRKKGDFPQAEVVEEVRDAFLDRLPGDISNRLKDLNRAYHELQVIQRAVGYQSAAEAGGVFSPIDLLKASRAEGNRRLFSAGNAVMQQPARNAQGLSPSIDTRRMGLGQQWGPSVAVGAAGFGAGGIPGLLTAYGAGIPAATEFVRRILLGQNAMQQRARPLVRILRRAQGPTGAAIATESESER